MTEKDTVNTLLIKGGSTWGAVGLAKYLGAIGIHDWGDVAAVFAAIYSFLLIADWIYKKVKK